MQQRNMTSWSVLFLLKYISVLLYECVFFFLSLVLAPDFEKKQNDAKAVIGPEVIPSGKVMNG